MPTKTEFIQMINSDKIPTKAEMINLIQFTIDADDDVLTDQLLEKIRTDAITYQKNQK